MSETSWNKLLAGAQRSAEQRLPGLREHQPSIAVLSCSDARVPPSVVFDQQAGELFIVRIAGNTASPTALASLDYAVEHLGIDLILVLGHTHCGAVAAAAAGVCNGPLAPIVNPICEIARGRPDADARMIERLNVECAVAALSVADGTIGDAVASGRVDVRGAIYDIESGAIREVVPSLGRAPAHQPLDRPAHQPLDHPAHQPLDRPAHQPLIHMKTETT